MEGKEEAPFDAAPKISYGATSSDRNVSFVQEVSYSFVDENVATESETQSDRENASTETDTFSAQHHRKSSSNFAIINSSNIWTSLQRNADKYEADLVPTQVSRNVKLALDPNLNQGEKGCLYYAETSFYNAKEPPAYALTVNTDIYQRVLAEIADSKHTPCGLYFCCHGGDGAHTGVSHDDHVDIRVAYAAVAFLFFLIVMLQLIDAKFNALLADDDFFQK